MGIQVQWDNDERTILLVSASKKRDMSDAYPAVEQINEMVASVDHPVTMIVYVELTLKLSPDFAHHFGQLIRQMSGRIADVVIVADVLMKTVVTVLWPQQHHGIECSFAATVDEARQLILSRKQEAVVSAPDTD